MSGRAKPPAPASTVSAPREGAGTTGPTAPAAERLLQALGAQATLAEDVLGDLAEEYALRTARDGMGAARWWYTREALRSAPHLVRSAMRNRSPGERARLAAWLAVPVFVSLGLVALMLGRSGPAAHLVPGVSGAAAERIVVSTLRPIKIPLRVLDASGHVLPDTGVRYAWESGARASVSPLGVARCAERGDAMVRATLGELVTRIRLNCQPVHQLRMKHWHNLVLGGPTQELRVGGIGLDGEPVTRLAADVSIRDRTVAVLDGTSIRPVAPGRTFVTVSVGSNTVTSAVTVFEPVRTLERLRPDQNFVVASVRLDPGQAVRWPLPEGRFWLVNQVNHEGDAPALDVTGPVVCMPVPKLGVYRTHCRARTSGAFVTLAHSRTATSAIVGELVLEKDARR